MTLQGAQSRLDAKLKIQRGWIQVTEMERAKNDAERKRAELLEKKPNWENKWQKLRELMAKKARLEEIMRAPSK